MSLLPWYHGGPPGRAVDEQLLPPATTGAPRLSDHAPAGAATAHVRDDCVYVTPDINVAAMYAVGHRGGVVYRVQPDGPLERDPDYLGPDAASWQTTAATVLEVIPVPRDVARRWRAGLAALAAEVGL